MWYRIVSFRCRQSFLFLPNQNRTVEQYVFNQMGKRASKSEQYVIQNGNDDGECATRARFQL